MTLRARLVWAIVALLAALAVAFGGVALAQRNYLIRQVDEDLLALSANSKALLVIANRVNSGAGAGAELLADYYVGVERADGRLVSVLTPAGDPDLLPRTGGTERIDLPVTRGTVSGKAERIRLVTTTLTDRRNVVVAVSLLPVEAATNRLLVSLGLAWLALAAVAGLVGWWVHRLGLGPIAAMTAAAGTTTAQLRAGAAPSLRVEAGPPGTEAGRLAEAFNTMIDATTGSQARLRQFVADASHELRTPLTTLRGYSSLHSAGGLTDPAQVDDAMRRINAEATRMSGIVDGLLDLTALDDGRALVRAEVDLVAVVRDVAADLRVTAPGRTITVEAPDRASVQGNDDRLRQALTALVANAQRHTPDGSPITLRVVPGAGVVRVEVADQGPGIPSEVQGRIFDRFYRLANGPPSASRGSGLGLAIVAAITQAHRGRYGVESTLGKGSTFWMELPAQ